MTGCGSNPKPAIVDHVAWRDHAVIVTPDPSLRTCQPRPAKPDLLDPQRAEKNLATALVELDARGADCAAKLAATWESIDQANAKAAAANAAADKGQGGAG